jgi:ubiquinone/menaquinone biosynthesis C-methylase UbiE
MEFDKINRLENDARVMELNPTNTLIRAGFRAGMTLCDIGAGTGLFSFAAAEISQNDIYALEISEQMIELLAQRMVERNVKNLIIKKVDSGRLPLDDNCCDMAIMVTVLHEVDNKESMLQEVKRILRHSGKLVIIEFHNRKTPMGPPVELRLAPKYVEEVCNKNGLQTLCRNSLGENLYIDIFENR